MFSPRAENLAMPGRLPAAPRSRWAKLSVLAMCADQSPATRARSLSHSRAARPRAWRSALSRLNRSLASFWAVVWLPAGALVGAVVGRGAGLVVVVAALVVVVAAVVVVGRTGRRAVAEPIRSWWAASTLGAQRTCSSQALAGWTAWARPALDDRRRADAIRVDWAPARADRRGTALRVGRP